MRDDIFKEKKGAKFSFDESVASVFDDMLNRSIPYYNIMLDLVVQIIIKNSNTGDRIYDLGCSTTKLLIELDRKAEHKLNLIGVDSSMPMIEQAKKKCKAYESNIELICGDILDLDYQKSKIFISNYTLQFIRPVQRGELVKKIYSSLNSGGIFIFSEKVISEDRELDMQLIDIYHKYKIEQGYSETEISRKREALENVLVPYSSRENEEMIKACGFDHIETLFRWANFTTYIAKKRDG